MAAAFKIFLVNVIGFANNAEAVQVRSMCLDLFAILAQYDHEMVQYLVRTLKKDQTSPLTIGPIIEVCLDQASSLAKHYVWILRVINSASLTTFSRTSDSSQKQREIFHHLKSTTTSSVG